MRLVRRDPCAAIGAPPAARREKENAVMLEFMRNRSQSMVVYLVLGIIIITFIISFGPAANKLTCGGEHVVATIDGEDVSMLEWQYARAMAGYFFRDRDGGVDVVRFAMDKTIERKILAHLAHENGIRFTPKDAEDMILKNRIVVFGEEVPLTTFGAWPIDPKTQKPLEFNYSRFHDWVTKILYITDERKFLEFQAEEMAAKAYRDAFLFGMANTQRSRWMNYQNEYVEITYKTARFAPEAFLNPASVTTEEITGFLASEEGKKAAEEKYASNEKKYSETPKKRHVLKAVVSVEPALLEAILKQEKKDPESLKAALADKAAALETVLRGAEQVKASVKENAPLPETFVSAGQFAQDSQDLDADILAKLWEAPLMQVQGPFFTQEGAVLYVAQNESGGKVEKEEGLRLAAMDILAAQKAAQAAQKAAEAALAALMAGKTPEQIQGMPEMLTEGPVNPLKGQEGLISRELATELFKLETPGKVLPRVVADEVAGQKVFKILVLESRKLPSREDFESQEANHFGPVSSRAMYAFDAVIKDQCVKYVRAGKVQLMPFLQRSLSYRRPADVSPEKAAQMPPEDYTPCQHVGTGSGSGL